MTRRVALYAFTATAVHVTGLYIYLNHEATNPVPFWATTLLVVLPSLPLATLISCALESLRFSNRHGNGGSVLRAHIVHALTLIGSSYVAHFFTGFCLSLGLGPTFDACIGFMAGTFYLISAVYALLFGWMIADVVPQERRLRKEERELREQLSRLGYDREPVEEEPRYNCRLGR